MPSAVPHAPRPGLFQVVEWRLVAAIGLPVWAFILGAVVMHRPAPAAPPESAAAAPPPAAVPTAPPPPEVTVRTEVRSVPVVVPIPIPVPAPAPAPSASVAAAAPAEFQLPPSEVMPADRCKTFDTRIRFHPDLAAAAAEAKASKKMLMVLHISGNFDDPGFT
jgi:hypothetical protein